MRSSKWCMVVSGLAVIVLDRMGASLWLVQGAAAVFAAVALWVVIESI